MQTEGCVRTRGEGGRRKLPYWHLDLRLLASRLWDKESPLCEPLGLWCLVWQPQQTNAGVSKVWGAKGLHRISLLKGLQRLLTVPRIPFHKCLQSGDKNYILCSVLPFTVCSTLSDSISVCCPNKAPWGGRTPHCILRTWGPPGVTSLPSDMTDS